MSKSTLSRATPPTSGAAARVGSSAIRDLLHLTERPEVISLAGGLPSADAFPSGALAEAATAALAGTGASALQYSTTEGLAELRAWVAARHPVPTDPDQVLVTAGSQQALDLLARTTLSPGDTVALADPGYVGALQVLRLAGADLAGIPVDADGLDTGALAERLAIGLRPTLVYVVAEFDNPSGVTLSDARRRHLADLADQYGFWIVEDDPYGALRWTGTAPTPLSRLSDRVVTLGTTSKVLAPGLRVGWMVAPAPLIREAVTLKQATDLHTSSLGQVLAAGLLLRPGFLEAHLEGLRDRYRRQADGLLGALDNHLGDRLEVHRPDGGMFCWATFRDGTDTEALLPRALATGVAYVAGGAFAVEAAHPHGLRLTFATADEATLAEAASRLATAVGRA